MGSGQTDSCPQNRHAGSEAAPFRNSRAKTWQNSHITDKHQHAVKS